MALVALALTGCAQMQIRRVATPDGSEIYDMRGRDPGRLASEAGVRCPRGYDVLRQSSKSDALESQLQPAQWWNTAMGYLHDADTQAQLVVSCKAPVVPALPLPAAPAVSPVPPEPPASAPTAGSAK